MAAGAGIPTPVSVDLNVPMAPGAIHGFYVTIANGSPLFASPGIAVGNVITADASLAILEGSTNAHAFGPIATPTAANLVVSHVLVAGCNLGANITMHGGSPPPPVPVPKSVPQMVGGMVTSPLPASAKLSWAWYVGVSGIPVAVALNVTPASHAFSYSWPSLGSGPGQELKLLVTASTGGCAQVVLPVCVYEPFRVVSSGFGDALVIGTGTGCFPSTIRGYTGFSFVTPGPVGGGPLLGLYPDLPLLLAILSLPPAPGSLFHFLVDGTSYPDAPISFPPGTFSALAGASVDALLLHLDAMGHPVHMSAVSRLTF